MSANSEADVPWEIGHVLFMDVVGYSKLLINEQRELQQQLSQIVRDTEPFRSAETVEKLIRLPVGDGMALVFFDRPEAPVLCPLEISKALKGNSRVQLRMGIHSGPVNQVRDVNDRTNIAGAGVNIAQRVMDCADGGHILLSKRVAEDLAQSRQWQPHLYDLGDCEVKHGVNIFVVNLYGDGFGNSQVPAKIRKTRGHSRRAVELKPESKDAFDGAIMNCYLALIYARVGENDLAISLIERLLKTPGAVDSVDYSVTVNDLKYRWEWDPIRRDPRFQKLIEQPIR